jgi:hypothetical protein
LGHLFSVSLGVAGRENDHIVAVLPRSPAVVSQDYEPAVVVVLQDLQNSRHKPIVPPAENRRRSIAMLPVGAPALNRDEALELLTQLEAALSELRSAKTHRQVK